MKQAAINILKHLPKNTLATLVVILAAGFGRYWYKNWEEKQSTQYQDLKNTIIENHEIMVADNQLLFDKINKTNFKVDSGFEITNSKLDRFDQKINILQKNQDKNTQWQMEKIDEIYQNINGKKPVSLLPIKSKSYFLTSLDTFKFELSFKK